MATIQNQYQVSRFFDFFLGKSSGSVSSFSFDAALASIPIPMIPVTPVMVVPMMFEVSLMFFYGADMFLNFLGSFNMAVAVPSDTRPNMILLDRQKYTVTK